MAIKTYFLMRNHDYPPDSLVKLGQIITSPKKPWEPIAGPLPIPDDELQRSFKLNWSTMLSQIREGRLGVWVQFLAQILGVGADVAVSWSKEHAELLQAEELQTFFIEPTTDYVAQSVLHREPVAKWIEENPRKAVYMVVGVKIVRGASQTSVLRRAVKGEIKLGVNAAPFSGVPVEGGPLGGGGIDRAEATQYQGSSDFVYAYRLRRIIIKRGVVMSNKEHLRGAETAGTQDHAGQLPLALEEMASQSNAKMESVELFPTDHGSGGHELPDFESTKVRDDGIDGSYEDCIVQLDDTVSPYGH